MSALDDAIDRLPEWGSDAIAMALRQTGIPFLALTPGSSYRGMHDSLVNFLGNHDPELLLCLHEEHAVALAHGYTKVTGEPMAIALHSNVGLMHASMAIFNAYCDRAPMLIIGANGPADASRRRPWIDWLHSSTDVGALVRPYVKWDDNPMSTRASVASIIRGNQVCRSEPPAPVYVCLDVTSQEERLVESPPHVQLDQHRPFPTPMPTAAGLADAASALRRAERPLILMGRVGRGSAEWSTRVRFAEGLGARVITHKRLGAAFPTRHSLHAGSVAVGLPTGIAALIRESDVILSLEWVDLGGTLEAVFGDEAPQATIISASIEPYALKGWTKLDFSLAPADIRLTGSADDVVQGLLNELGPWQRGADRGSWRQRTEEAEPVVTAETGKSGRLMVAYVQEKLRAAVGRDAFSLVRLPFAWDFRCWPFEGPLEYLGGDGGGGIGSGPGMAVGAALALRGSGRLPIAVLGDGDYLMGLTALWTAARYRIPLLVLVMNNRSYYNDELHQIRVAQKRDRPVENATIGIRLDDPEPDLATLAAGQGLVGLGPITDPASLGDALKTALDIVRAGGCAVVDVHVEAGYGASS